MTARTARTVRAAAEVSAVGARPVVKWAGGKTKLLGELEARLPPAFNRYFEPFFGGGALFFALRAKSAVLSDSNADLMTMYRCVANNVEAVIRRLRVHARKHSPAYYYRVRDNWNLAGRRSDPLQRAAAFLYMNKTCFNGLWRVNQKGGFNVPIGRYAKPQIVAADKLRAAAVVLQGCRLVVANYHEAVEEAGPGDFVYFDPPYCPRSPTANFTSYTAQGFGPDDHRGLATLAGQLVERGCHVMLSNADVPFVRGLYKGFQIDRVATARAINSKAHKRGRVAELIIASRR